MKGDTGLHLPLSPTWSRGLGLESDLAIPRAGAVEGGEVIRSVPAVKDPRERVLFGPGCLGGSCLLLDKTGFWNFGGT